MPNEETDTYEGCYGEQVSYQDLGVFLGDAFNANMFAEKCGCERFATCIWGHSGIGKTALVKAQAAHPVEWAGTTYPGYKVVDVPLAQFEEMGDLHGMPARHVLVAKENGKGPIEHWVPEEVLSGYVADGFEILHRAGIRTMYAPPDWVPTEPGPTIVLLDDWNRASVRIIKGVMQLLQNYGMVSWKLPPGCSIVMTANPDEQDYLVTSLDPAILTRQRHITLKHDAKEWSIWATREKIDPRVINFVLQYPEMMIGSERTNPRTLSEVGRCVRTIPDFSSKDNMRRFKMMAASLLDEATVSTMIVFMERDVELIVEPEQVLKGESWIDGHLKKLMSGGAEARVDVLSVICDRLLAHVVQPDTEQDTKSVENFQAFVTGKYVPEDMRHNMCQRIFRRQDGRSHQWLLHNKLLTKMIMEVV